jgi:hypothetical protein
LKLPLIGINVKVIGSPSYKRPNGKWKKAAFSSVLSTHFWGTLELNLKDEL